MVNMPEFPVVVPRHFSNELALKVPAKIANVVAGKRLPCSTVLRAAQELVDVARDRTVQAKHRVLPTPLTLVLVACYLALRPFTVFLALHKDFRLLRFVARFRCRYPAFAMVGVVLLCSGDLLALRALVPALPADAAQQPGWAFLEETDCTGLNLAAS
jgi:hypothetical protein